MMALHLNFIWHNWVQIRRISMVLLLSHSFLTSLKTCKWLYKQSVIHTYSCFLDCLRNSSLNSSVVTRRNAVAHNIGWFWNIFITWNILLDKIIRYSWREHFWLTGLFVLWNDVPSGIGWRDSAERPPTV